MKTNRKEIERKLDALVDLYLNGDTERAPFLRSHLPKFHSVTHIRRNWNQTVTELIAWDRLGRDIAMARGYA